MEAFTADHNVTIDEVLYEWPASRFEYMYDAFARRKVADELNNRRTAEIAASWSNPNLDNEKDPEARTKFMENLDEHYSKNIARLYGEIIEEESEIDQDDPFFKAMKRGMEKRKLPNSTEVTDEE